MRVVPVLFAAALAACGDGAQALPLAPDASAPDAPVYPACAEFGVSATAVPARVTSTVSGADVESPASCATMDAPYGAESKGPDRVVPVSGLRVGATYVVKLEATSDLGFYVSTGCATATGPAADQCLLFEDASLGGTEVGRFVATSGVSYVVVDFYSSQQPTSTVFALEVYEEQCTSDAQCGGATPACADGLCVECATSFDCTTSAKPRCDLETNACTPGVDQCAMDDTAEPLDDGPAGARVLVSGVAQTGSVCSKPRSEADFYAFDVTSLGEVWDLSLAWSGSADLDLELYDANGATFGLSFWEQPERARLTHLPIGRYYARVSEFSTDVEGVAYTLTASRGYGAACTSSADCASEYRNQIFRGACTAGACVKIEGAGTLAEGTACDSQSDCGANLSCPAFFFVADADTRATCTRGCTYDAQCDVGDVCTTYFASNFCVPACTTDAQCPTSLDDQPLSGPWYQLRCNLSSGRCTQ
ncbi:MAG: hypothetical protein M4D80_30150 [Myxococcota bacterium]|nr:hypothetical protein [Myxococcota bacterium]